MQLSLHNGSSSGVTIISNIFIDHYMPHANGEFVKIYLYLLRCLKSERTNFELSHVADVFDCTEADVLRTLRYWETQKLVVLSGTAEQTSIDFLEPMPPQASASVPTTEHTAVKPAKTVKKTASPKKIQQNVSDPMPEAAPALEITEKEARPEQPNADRLRELKEKDEVRQMLFIAEQYMGTTLNRTVTDELLYIYDKLNFSVDLIDYLIEYCVSKGSRDIHYIKTVAFKWYEAGIDTVSKAKQESTTFHRNYFTILKAFGITNRNPVPSEITTFNHWLNDYGFTLDIITEACTRTIAQIGKVNYRYTTKILSDWHNKGVRHLTDIQALDTLHRQLQADRADQKSSKKPISKSGSVSNNFNNFKQRDYDYAALENQLLNQ